MQKIKYTAKFLTELEDIFLQANYQVRYEKGKFKSGYCILKDERLIVINKYFPKEGRINSLIDILQKVEIQESDLQGKTRELYQFLNNPQLTLPKT